MPGLLGHVLGALVNKQEPDSLSHWVRDRLANGPLESRVVAVENSFFPDVYLFTVVCDALDPKQLTADGQEVPQPRYSYVTPRGAPKPMIGQSLEEVCRACFPDWKPLPRAVERSTAKSEPARYVYGLVKHKIPVGDGCFGFQVGQVLRIDGETFVLRDADTRASRAYISEDKYLPSSEGVFTVSRAWLRP